MGPPSLIPNWKGQSGITNCRLWASAQTLFIFHNLQERKQLRNLHDNMFNTKLTTYKTGGALSDKSMHPGEYGRVSAWIKKIKNDLVLNKDIYGHPPSTVFERPANQYVRAMTSTDPGAGYAALGGQQSYIVAADGTPLLKRNIDFSPPDTAGASNLQSAAQTLLNLQPPQTPGARPEYITIANPDFIPPARHLN